MPRSALELATQLLSYAGKHRRKLKIAQCTEAIENGDSAASVLARFLDDKVVPLYVPPGHFYSPIVNPEEIAEYYREERRAGEAALAGVNISREDVLALWDELTPLMNKADFPTAADATHRFFSPNGNFPYADGAVLRAMIGYFKPARIVEIGSGNSSACALDAIDDFGLPTSLTCIEPYPQRLRERLRASDFERVTLIKEMVQNAPLSVFDALSENDILFVDSTHVFKTGSDVYHELFHILPRLRERVIIHFHDCPFPFEYPRRWALELNHSWNELYALRAFLTDNPRYEIIAWASYILKEMPELADAIDPRMAKPLGSSLWLRKVGLPQ